MPNWCYCDVRISGGNAISLEIFEDILEKYEEDHCLNFEKIAPVPKIENPKDIWEQVDLYYKAWGTRGYGFNVILHSNNVTLPNSDIEIDEIILSMECKWSPCDGIVKKLSTFYPNNEFLLEYTEEQGPNAFSGYLVFKNGATIVKEYFEDYNEDTLCDIELREMIFPNIYNKQIVWNPKLILIENKKNNKYFSSMKSIGNSIEKKFNIPKDIFEYNVMPYVVDFLFEPRDMRPASIDQRIKGYPDFKEHYYFLYEEETDEETDEENDEEN